mmetsp:Transcript_14545/g.36541  ORF Transcript_14545/g.36541 Transcript_14545/m.36541 type:complete len:348 (-) Transcript_14545:1613-2656(-)
MVANRLWALGEFVVESYTRQHHVLPGKIHHFFRRILDKAPCLALANEIVVQQISQRGWRQHHQKPVLSPPRWRFELFHSPRALNVHNVLHDVQQARNLAHHEREVRNAHDGTFVFCGCNAQRRRRPFLGCGKLFRIVLGLVFKTFRSYFGKLGIVIICIHSRATIERDIHIILGDGIATPPCFHSISWFAVVVITANVLHSGPYRHCILVAAAVNGSISGRVFKRPVFRIGQGMLSVGRSNELSPNQGKCIDGPLGHGHVVFLNETAFVFANVHIGVIQAAVFSAFLVLRYAPRTRQCFGRKGGRRRWNVNVQANAPHTRIADFSSHQFVSWIIPMLRVVCCCIVRH